MKTDRLSCLVPVNFYVKNEDPRSYHKGSFLVYPKDGEYDSRSHNIIWEGRFDSYIITITQEHHNADVEEEHIKIEKNPTATTDPSMTVSFSKKEIARTLNKYIDEVFA